MTYTVKEAAQHLGITTRAVQKRAKEAGLFKTGKSYNIPEELVKLWNTDNDNEPITNYNEPENEPGTNTDNEEVITESFSQEQYDKLQEVIYHYPELLERIQDYKNEIEYLRKSLDKKSEQMDVLISTLNDSIKSIQQQNYLKAKESGYDTE